MEQFSIIGTVLTANADFEIKDRGGGVIITKYVGWNAAVEIPSRINGKSVTAIGDYAFKNKELTSVIIPDCLASIGDEAFADNRLTSVSVPSQVSFIGILAFAHNRLTSVTIPNGVSSIGDYTFSCNRLTSVVIPDSVVSLGNGAFSRNDLTNIVIGADVRLSGYVLDGRFDRFYEDGGRRAGMYIYSDSKWNFKER
jgi:hypothetical protein